LMKLASRWGLGVYTWNWFLGVSQTRFETWFIPERFRPLWLTAISERSGPRTEAFHDGLLGQGILSKLPFFHYHCGLYYGFNTKQLRIDIRSDVMANKRGRSSMKQAREPQALRVNVRFS